jgi:16S rRNA (guanine527-N7)-methyltransferase
MDICRTKLQQGLTKLSLQIGETRIEALLNFIKLIEKWNQAYNLTAIRNPEEMVSMHILDSLSILPYVIPYRIADIGTGAGLPGIPLAICLPDCFFVLVDSNSKKTRFVQQAALELKLKNVEIVHSRVELFKPQQLFSTLITRAFAEMSQIYKLTSHLLDDQGQLLAMKGQSPDQELKTINIDYKVIPLNVPGINAERCLIQLKRPKDG